ncbi:MAG: M20/M25/M40 family metallo-hydrolase [Chloroflexota bacterium]|nr:M20/M25/M40 family metallo-hydrolase [Chloroflexota bacterium]
MAISERDVEQLLSELVRIDSVTPWLIPGGAGEGDIARYMAGWLDGTGAEVSLEEVEPGRPNLVARLPGSGGGRSLCLNAHADTVGYANWADRALRPERSGDRLIGVGVADDKSSCAIGLLTMREIAKSGNRLRGDLVVACTVDEEGSSIGTSDLVRRHGFDGAIILEPEGVGKVIVEHQGFGWVDIVVHGRAAHGSAPEKGIDAIAHMAEVIRGLGQLNERFRSEPPQLSGTTVLHTGTIVGGTDYATYPSSCVLGIEIGTQPGEKLSTRVAEIEAIFQDCRARLPGFSAQVVVKLERDPFKAERHESLLAAADRAAERVTGTALQRVGLNAWADGALMQAAGIPTLHMGALGGNFHAPDEWVSLPECVSMAELVRQTAIEFCG